MKEYKVTCKMDGVTKSIILKARDLGMLEGIINRIQYRPVPPSNYIIRIL